jgi:ATP-dependent RNA helicase RhlE
MFDLISQGHIDISKLEFLVLDEADLMLDMGFLKDIQDVSKHIPQRRQTLFFSATITPEIKKVAYSVVRNAIRIQIAPHNPVAGNIEHSVTYVSMDDKRFFLENILKEYEESKFIVFVRTQIRAGRVVEAMKRVGIDTEALHGGVEQKDRFAILDRFRSGENRVLITTDVSARGIDIPTVEYVINYDVPDNPENYVHRCGRCGRGSNKGSAISFCSEEEKPLIAEIEVYTGEEIEYQEIDRDDYKDILRDSDDGSYDWKKLMRDANKEAGTEEEW